MQLDLPVFSGGAEPQRAANLWKISIVQTADNDTIFAQAATKQRAPGFIPYGPGSSCSKTESRMPKVVLVPIVTT